MPYHWFDGLSVKLSKYLKDENEANGGSGDQGKQAEEMMSNQKSMMNNQMNSMKNFKPSGFKMK